MKLRECINTALRPLGSILKRPGWGDDWKRDIPSLLSPGGDWYIFDCGANKGQTLEQMLPLYPMARYHAFEPFPATFRILEKSWGGRANIALHPLALSNENGTAIFFTHEDSATNSLFSSADPVKIENQASITVTRKTLDAFTQEQDIRSIDLLKMDCQGAELQILQGAAGLLESGRIQVIYTEVLFTPLYRGQAYFDELCAFLRQFNYHLLALYDGHRSHQGHLLWSNALFSRQDDAPAER